MSRVDQSIQPTRTKLTDLQKKKIIADYVNNNNYSETARMNGVKVETVRRIVKADKDFVRKSEAKKEENTKDILDYMDSISEEQKEIINLSLKAVKEKLKKVDAFTNVKDIITVYGIIVDKTLKLKEYKDKTPNTNESKKVVIINDLPRPDDKA